MVTVERRGLIDRVLIPGPSLAIESHSPDGFEWGYPGSGPAQLALALLLDFTGDRHWAAEYHQPFKFAYVVGWDGPAWQISGAEIVAWLQAEGAPIAPGMIPGDARTGSDRWPME